MCTPHVGYVSREEYDVQFVDLRPDSSYAGRPARSMSANPEVLGFSSRRTTDDRRQKSERRFFCPPWSVLCHSRYGSALR